jgi:F-type H+-transporting ATPase subunit epsilon
MLKKIKLKIITPEALVLDELVDQVSLPTKNGEITILPGHIPLITDLSSGDIVSLVNNEYVPIAVVGGFIEIKNNEDLTEVAILADFAEHIANLSEEIIKEAKIHSEELKKEIDKKEKIDFERLSIELERSLTRVKIADKWRTKKYRKF